MNTHEIRKMAMNEEIDYLFLKYALRSYAQPRFKINSMLKNKELIRVKKGLYVFGERYSQKPYVKETLANLIYGPSCLSLEYVLSFYGMIPERVEVITNVTNKRDKVFHTPIGHFTYRYLSQSKYTVGITEMMIDETHPILIATPEKALADKIMLASPGLQLNTVDDVANFIYEDLRIVEEKFVALNLDRFTTIANVYKNNNVSKVCAYLRDIKGNQ
jgi:hypothetical protein